MTCYKFNNRRCETPMSNAYFMRINDTQYRFISSRSAAVCEADSLYSFKCKLETNLFTLCFNYGLLADRNNGRAIGTLFRPSVCLSVVCDVMYCG